MADPISLTILCVATYEKGHDFIREFRRQGCRVLLLRAQKLGDEPRPRDCIDGFYYLPETISRDDLLKGALAGWAWAGGVSTLSHGVILFLTATMWGVGIPVFNHEKRAGEVHDAHLAGLFARFPQGLPPGFDPQSLGALPSVAR